MNMRTSRISRMSRIKLFIIAIYRMIKDDNFIAITYNDNGYGRCVYRTNSTTRLENIVMKSMIESNIDDGDNDGYKDRFDELLNN